MKSKSNITAAIVGRILIIRTGRVSQTIAVRDARQEQRQRKDRCKSVML